MSGDEKVCQLRSLITDRLGPLFNGRPHVLLEVPHHANVGDFLIWEGEAQFLRSQASKCIGVYSDSTFGFFNLPANVIIAMNGGGSFGDIWKESLEFKLKVVKAYPDNQIIFFPQSVEFVDDQVGKEAIDTFKSHNNLVVCARDSYSYDFLSGVGIKTLLVPDIAFYMDVHADISKKSMSVETLVVQREDREKSRAISSEFNDLSNTMISDWPTVGTNDRFIRAASILSWVLRDCAWAGRLLDILYNYVYRRYIVKSGIGFINSARVIHATRLHAGILGILLRKNVILYENSYGKLDRFYRTWLFDCDSVSYRK